MSVFLHHIWVVKLTQNGAQSSSITLVSYLPSVVTLCCEVVEGLPWDLLQVVVGAGRGSGKEYMKGGVRVEGEVWLWRIAVGKDNKGEDVEGWEREKDV